MGTGRNKFHAASSIIASAKPQETMAGGCPPDCEKAAFRITLLKRDGVLDPTQGPCELGYHGDEYDETEYTTIENEVVSNGMKNVSIASDTSMCPQ